MTVDERIEALTQSLELLTHDVHDMQHVVHDMQHVMRDMQGFIREVAEGTARLLHVAQVHEQRIGKLEGQTD